MESFQATIQKMLNEDKRRDTFKLLASLTGLKLDREEIFVIGGSQQFSQHHSSVNNHHEQQMAASSNDDNNSILCLPDEVYLHLFSFLSPIDLCQASIVCKKWHRLASDDNVWRQRLNRDMKTWSTISSRSNPHSFALVDSDRSQKEIYLTCSPTIHRLKNPMDESLNYFYQIPEYLRNWLGNSKQFIMFGPGLESYTSPLVKNLIWDESKRFQTIGMIPGNAGFGSGIKMKLNNQIFNLITLYTNCMTVRESRNTGERLATNNHLVQSNNTEHFEITTQVRDVCRDAHGLIYVIDSNRENDLRNSSTELQVMTREFSQQHLLILSCVRDRETKRWASIDVVEHLGLSSMGNTWLVQDCCVENMAGVENGFTWLLNPKPNRSSYFSNKKDEEDEAEETS